VEPVDRILSKLQRVKPSGEGWTALCPSHNDQTNSLSIGEGDDSRVLLKCHAGCSVEKIVNGIGLELKDLFPTGEGGGVIPPVSSATAQHSGCTLKNYADAKGLPVDFLKGLGLYDLHLNGTPALGIPYKNKAGKTVSIRHRCALKKTPNGDNRFRWKSGNKTLLYGLSCLDTDAKSVVLVEGESDSHTLWYHRFNALGLPGAGNWRENRDAEHLEHFDTIFVVIEPDDGGDGVKKWLQTSRIRDHVRLVKLGQYKDPSGLYLDDRERFHDRFQKALDNSVAWADFEDEETRGRAAEAWGICEELAIEERILNSFCTDIRRAGVVGEEQLAKVLFLSMVSRFLQRPVSVAVKGPSSGGKSFVVEKVLNFFPDATYHALTGMSERNLAFCEEPLSHRFLVIYEAVGMEGDIASYFIRSLLSEGRIDYEFVDKGPDGLKSRKVEIEGPTGLITTTTKIALHPENETRLLSLTVTDTPEQTKDIFLAMASDAEPLIDHNQWHSLQTWLTSGEHRVYIPFAEPLAELVQPTAVRLRRDFKTILNLIKAHAILHQASRERDADGQIIANIDDYAVIRDLVADLIAEGVEVTVSRPVRETVNEVEELINDDKTTISVNELAKGLDLDKSTVSRRVRRALKLGYLKNDEERKGRPYCLRLGDDLPEDVEILPSPDQLLHCCTATGGDDAPPSSYEAVVEREQIAI